MDKSPTPKLGQDKIDRLARGWNALPAPKLTDEEAARQLARSRVIAWGLVGLAVVFLLGTGVRLAGADSSMYSLTLSTLLIVAILMPGLIFTLPLTIAWAIAGVMSLGTLYVWVAASQPLSLKVVSLILTGIVLVQMVMRQRAASHGEAGDK